MLARDCACTADGACAADHLAKMEVAAVFSIGRLQQRKYQRGHRAHFHGVLLAAMRRRNIATYLRRRDGRVGLTEPHENPHLVIGQLAAAPAPPVREAARCATRPVPRRTPRTDRPFSREQKK